MPENGRFIVCHNGRKAVLQHCPVQMLCAETRKDLHETIVVGQMRKEGNSETGASARQPKVLRFGQQPTRSIIYRGNSRSA